MTPTNTERYDFLDWLRVLAIFLLLFYHTGMLFVGWGWHITNADTIPALQLPMDLAHRLRMPLLFLIAGAGMWFALRRRTLGAFTGERTLRLLVPAIAGMFLIVPAQVYIERLANGDWQRGYFAFFFERVLQFEPYPEGNFSWHHLWFIIYLFVYVLLLLPFMAWWRRAKPELRPGAWLFLAGLPLGINEALLKPFFPETHNLTSDWYTFIHYLLLTVYGFVLASMPGAWDWLARHRRKALAAGLVIVVGGLSLIEVGVIRRDTPADSLLANCFTWTWLMTFLGYGRQHLGFSNRLLRWARDASYPIYILHQTVIIVIAWFVVSRSWAPGSKYWVVLLATMAICVMLYEAIRRVAPLRFLFGMKPSRDPGPHASTPREALSSRTEAS